MPVKAVPTLSTIQRLLDEVEDWASHVSAIRAKMARLRPGGEAYLDHLADLNVELDWLEEKAKHAGEAIDEYMEALPDDE